MVVDPDHPMDFIVPEVKPLFMRDDVQPEAPVYDLGEDEGTGERVSVTLTAEVPREAGDEYVNRVSLAWLEAFCRRARRSGFVDKDEVFIHELGRGEYDEPIELSRFTIAEEFKG